MTREGQDEKNDRFDFMWYGEKGLSLWLRRCPHVVAWNRLERATDKMLIAPEATV